MTNNYSDENTGLILTKILSVSDAEIDGIIKNAIICGNMSWVKNIMTLLGFYRVQFLIEGDIDILKKCVENKHFEIVQYLILETNLSSDLIPRIFLNEVPPLELSKAIDLLNYKTQLILAVIANDIDKVNMLLLEKFDNYPEKRSLNKKLMEAIFLKTKVGLEFYKQIIRHEKLVDFLPQNIDFSLNAAIYSNHLEILEYLILDLKVIRNSSVELILSLDSIGCATKLFNTRDLKDKLEKELSENEDKRSGRGKI